MHFLSEKDVYTFFGSFLVLYMFVKQSDYLDHGDRFMCVLTLYVTVAMCD